MNITNTINMIYSKFSRNNVKLNDADLEQAGLSQIILNTKLNTKFVIYRHNTKTVITVSEKEFNDVSSGIINQKPFLCKYTHITRRAAVSLFRKVLPKTLTTQSISEAMAGINWINSLLTEVGKRTQIQQGTVAQGDSSFSITDKLTLLAANVADFIGLYHSIADKPFTLSSFLFLVLQMARTVVGVKFTVKVLRTQSVEAILCSILSLALPPSIMDIVKRMSLFTSIKLFDDTSFILTLMSTFMEYTEKCISYVLGVPFNFSSEFSSFFSFGQHFLLINSISKAISQATKDRTIFLNPEYRATIKATRESAEACPAYIEWRARSATLKAAWSKFEDIHRISLAYDSADRVEPFAFIFEGPAGCGKSVLMNKLVNAMNRTTYVHDFKTTNEPKDFYERYNDEEIFVVDDIGSKGPSEYGKLIKIISSTTCPLDCADLHKKDTKRFTSRALIMSTNYFRTLDGKVTKADNIGDVAAVWRRPIVFCCQTQIAGNGEIEGAIHVKYYDILDGRWKDGVHPDVARTWREVLPDEELVTTYRFATENNVTDFLKWAGSLYQVCYISKETNYLRNKVVEADKTMLAEHLTRIPRSRNTEATLVQQGFAESIVSIYDIISEVLDTHVVENFNKCKDSAMGTLASLITSETRAVIGTSMYAILTSSFISIASFTISEMYKSWWRSGKKTKKELLTQGWQKILTASSTKVKESTCVEAVKKNFMICRIQKDNTLYVTNCLVSGHYVLAPSHLTSLENGYMTLFRTYDDMEKDNRAVDNIPFSQVFRDSTSDIVIFRMDKHALVAFKSMAKYFNRQVSIPGTWLVAPGVSIPLDGECSLTEEPYTYDVLNTPSHLYATGTLEYKYAFEGLCGAMIFKEGQGFVGMHVAGTEDDTVGFARLWSISIVDAIKNILSEDKYILDIEIKDKPKEGFSGLEVRAPISASTPKKSHFVPSPLYGVFPVTRIPVDMSTPHLVKDLFKASMCTTRIVPEKELEFMRRVVSGAFEPYQKLSHAEVINGTAVLAGINKDNSTGMFSLPDRDSYIDYENSCYKQPLIDEITRIKDSIRTGNLDIRDIVEKATLKDEVRNVEKKGKPRCFIILRFAINVLLKEYTGGMVESVMKHRGSNGVEVGINPYNDFDALWRSLDGAMKIDTDVEMFDKKMLGQIQFMVRDVLTTKFQGSKEDVEILTFLLTLLIVALCVANDDLYITTHSMPSGCYLTSIVNSLVSLCYISGFFYRTAKEHNIPATMMNFRMAIEPHTYGDDILMGIKLKPEIFNALTYDKYMRTLGLSLTTSTKTEISEPFSKPTEVQFLKRTFRWHDDLRKFVGPLDRRTMESSLSWLDKDKDVGQVMTDKIHAFQREAYLHEDGALMVDYLEAECRKRNFPFARLTRSYLFDLFDNEEVPYMDPSGDVRNF